MVDSDKSRSIVSTSFTLPIRLDLGFPEPLYIVYWTSLGIVVICDAFYLLTCTFFKLCDCFGFLRYEVWSPFDVYFHQFCRLDLSLNINVSHVNFSLQH